MTTLIKVCGAGRSGTTMLDLMLGNSRDAFSCGEVIAWFRPWRKHHFELECQCGQNPCSVWEKIAYVQESDFHESLFSKLDVNFVIDSSKELCWILDSQKWAVSKKIATYNILIWKNPINLAYSHWKRGRPLDFWYKEFVSYHEKLIRTNLPFRSINYNELVKNPQEKLAQICKLVGMPYFEGKERFWENQHHFLFGSGTTSKQTSEGHSEIRAKDNFPPEFEAHIQDFEHRVAQDTRLQQILNELNKNDIQFQLDYYEQEKIFTPRQQYPLWYFGKKSKGIVRRYFPENYAGAI